MGAGGARVRAARGLPGGELAPGAACHRWRVARRSECPAAEYAAPLPAASAQACARRCDERPGCSGFAWGAAGELCALSETCDAPVAVDATGLADAEALAPLDESSARALALRLGLPPPTVGAWDGNKGLYAYTASAPDPSYAGQTYWSTGGTEAEMRAPVDDAAAGQYRPAGAPFDHFFKMAAETPRPSAAPPWGEERVVYHKSTTAWSGAKEACGPGARLAIFDAAAKHEQGLALKKSGHAWLDGYDSWGNLTFFWGNGVRLPSHLDPNSTGAEDNYVVWQGVEPDGAGGQQCLMEWGGNHEGWGSWNCESQFGYYCQSEPPITAGPGVEVAGGLSAELTRWQTARKPPVRGRCTSSSGEADESERLADVGGNPTPGSAAEAACLEACEARPNATACSTVYSIDGCVVQFGDGVRDHHEEVGNTLTSEACAEMVRHDRPDANGLIWVVGTRTCFALYGTRPGRDLHPKFLPDGMFFRETCMFGEEPPEVGCYVHSSSGLAGGDGTGSRLCWIYEGQDNRTGVRHHRVVGEFRAPADGAYRLEFSSGREVHGSLSIERSTNGTEAASVCGDVDLDGSAATCTDAGACSYTAAAAAVVESCVDTDSSGDDCDGFAAGDESSCAPCDYTAPVPAVAEACADLTTNEPASSVSFTAVASELVLIATEIRECPAPGAVEYLLSNSSCAEEGCKAISSHNECISAAALLGSDEVLGSDEATSLAGASAAGSVRRSSCTADPLGARFSEAVEETAAPARVAERLSSCL